jgi:glycosyltransferase involved in cell wall biosynthesis
MTPSGTPILSVGVPVYNGERYLRATLDSILAQTVSDLELIISDNASTDGTEAICRGYAEADPRIRYTRLDSNIGAARNYARVFALASGDFFKWNNADDPIGPTFVERCLEVLRRDPGVVMAYPKTRLIDDTGAAIADFDDNLHLMSDAPSRRFMQVMEVRGLSNAMYGVVRREVMARTRLMGSFIGSDWVFVAELALHGRFYEVPEVLFFRRMHADSFTSQQGSVSKLIEFYNPQSRRTVELYRWRNQLEYARTILRSPMPLIERSRALIYLLKTTVWERKLLAAEAWMGAKMLVSSGRRSAQ